MFEVGWGVLDAKRNSLTHFWMFEGGVFAAKKNFPALYVVEEGHFRLRGPTHSTRDTLNYMGEGGGQSNRKYFFLGGGLNPIQLLLLETTRIF